MKNFDHINLLAVIIKHSYFAVHLTFVSSFFIAKQEENVNKILLSTQKPFLLYSIIQKNNKTRFAPKESFLRE